MSLLPRHLLREMLEHGQQRVRRRLTEAADRGVAHRSAEIAQQALVPAVAPHQLDRLLAANAAGRALAAGFVLRSEEHTSELQSLMRISYAGFCLKKKTITQS